MAKLQKRNKDLSIIIVSFNTKEVLRNCLQSIESLKSDLSFEVIISDNGSEDGSVELVEEEFPKYKLIKNNANLGFSKGNNVAKKHVNSDTVLFLNSDTLVHENSFDLPYQYLKENEDIGAVTVKTVLPNGEYDPDMRRRFPTPLVSLSHFSGFSKTYRYEDISPETIHEIDVAQGAYLMVKKKILDRVGWFDEDYFLDGEDIDLCWKIKEIDYKIIYYPDAYITHLKKASKNADRKKSLASVTRGAEAMRIFYKKHLEKRYPFLVNALVNAGITLLKLGRIARYRLPL